MQSRIDIDEALRRIQKQKRWHIFASKNKSFFIERCDIIDENGIEIANNVYKKDAEAIVRSHNETITSIRLLTGLVISCNITINQIHSKIKGINDELQNCNSVNGNMFDFQID